MTESSAKRAGSPDFDHPDQVLAFIDEIRSRNLAAVERYERYAEQVGGLTGVGYSADGTVSAEVDHIGVIAKVGIPDASLRHGSHLGKMILTAINEAQAARALKLAELGAALGGGQTLEMVRKTIPEHVRDAIDRRQDQRGGFRG